MIYVRCINIKPNGNTYLIRNPLTLNKIYKVIEEDYCSITLKSDNNKIGNFMIERFVRYNNELNINTKVL